MKLSFYRCIKVIHLRYQTIYTYEYKIQHRIGPYGVQGYESQRVDLNNVMHVA
jgi:hypothetical protein